MVIKYRFQALIFLHCMLTSSVSFAVTRSLGNAQKDVTPRVHVARTIQFKHPKQIDLKKMEPHFNVPVSPALEKYYAEVDSVDGWFDRRVIIILLLIDQLQSQQGIVGNLGEIGVWQGKSFIPLMHLAKPGENVAAIDCFELYQFNRDNSGGLCNAEPFNNNVKKYCSQLDKLKIIKGDSVQFTAHDYVSAMGNGKPFRIFSIDGCHEAEPTAIDMHNAVACLASGGVVIMDDYFHWGWPGVSEGVNFFMNKNVDCLKPFLIAWNKVFFTHAHYAKKYFDMLKEVFIPQDISCRRFFSVDTLIYDPKP